MRISDWSSDVCSSDLAAHGSVSLQTAVSFGDIPSFAQFNVTAVSPASGAQGTGVDVTLTGIGFDADTSFASGFGDGITVSNVHVVNATTATATLQIADRKSTRLNSSH